MVILQCSVCDKEYAVRPYRANRSKFCSSDCFGKTCKGRIPKSAFKPGFAPIGGRFKSGSSHPYFGKSSPALGKRWKLTQATRGRMREALKLRTYRSGYTRPELSEEKHPAWKGNAVGYQALHQWVSKHLGKPLICVHCGRQGGDSRAYQWANKSREYYRDLTDWLRLCVKCHKRYDSRKE